MPRHYRHWVEMQTLTQLRSVHRETDCAGDICPIHNPTAHHMRSRPLHWRSDRSMLERICDHGIGHPDPDHLPRWRQLGHEANAVHGCCGCCLPPEER